MSSTNNNMGAARAFGGLFILTFFAYGVGTAMIEPIVKADDAMVQIQANRPTVIIAIILMAIVHTFANVGLASIMSTIIKPYFGKLSTIYLGLAIASTVTLMIGAIFLALGMPLSELFAGVGEQDGSTHTLIGKLLVGVNFYSYQVGMTIWGIGGILLCFALLRTRLVPVIFAIAGLLGYAVFIVGTIAELYGIQIGVMLAIPGGFVEIALSIWLIIKGFDYSTAGYKEA